jgi:hypothetical protein
MRTDLAYEVHCVSDPASAIGRIGTIIPRPGGILLATDGHSQFLEIDDPDDQLIDDESTGYVEITTAKGRYFLNAIDRDAGEELSPFFQNAPAEFDSDEAAQAFYQKLLAQL